MAERIRYHLDEHIDPHIAEALRRHGVDVTTTNEAGLRTREDDAHVVHFRSEKRVMVTDDTDFLPFAATTADHPGIVYCPRQAMSVGQVIRGLILIYEVLGPADMAGRVEYL